MNPRNNFNFISRDFDPSILLDLDSKVNFHLRQNNKLFCNISSLTFATFVGFVVCLVNVRLP